MNQFRFVDTVDIVDTVDKDRFKPPKGRFKALIKWINFNRTGTGVVRWQHCKDHGDISWRSAD